MNRSKLHNIIKESINNILIEQEVNEYIDNLICEAYGISIELENKADELCDEIKKCYKNIEGYKDNFGNIIKNGKINFSFKEKSGVINYTIVNFVTEERLHEFYNYYTFNGKINKNTGNIELTIAMYNGAFTIDTYGNAVQHELSHLLDKIYYGDDEVYENLNKVYSITKKVLNGHYDEKVIEFAKCMYISFKTEQIANANGLDNMFRNGLTIIQGRSTDEYRYVPLLRKVLNNFNDYKFLCKNLYNKSEKWCYDRFMRTYSDYARRIGRVFMKKKEECNEISIKKEKPLKILM